MNTKNTRLITTARDLIYNKPRVIAKTVGGYCKNLIALDNYRSVAVVFLASLGCTSSAVKMPTLLAAKIT